MVKWSSRLIHTAKGFVELLSLFSNTYMYYQITGCNIVFNRGDPSTFLIGINLFNVKATEITFFLVPFVFTNINTCQVP